MADKLGNDSRFRSLQIGVSQESFGGSIQKNMSWSGPNARCRPKRFRIACSTGFSARAIRAGSIANAASWTRCNRTPSCLSKNLPKEDEQRLDEHLSSIRDLERAVASLPPDYQKVTAPDEEFDMKDWPRVAKLQSDLLAYALATRQTRVASYMLTKCQGLARFPVARPYGRTPSRLYA